MQVRLRQAKTLKCITHRRKFLLIKDRHQKMSRGAGLGGGGSNQRNSTWKGLGHSSRKNFITEFSDQSYLQLSKSYQLSFTTYRSCWTFENSNSTIFKHAVQSFHEIFLDVVWRERKWKENFFIICHRFASSRSINCCFNEIMILRPVSYRKVSTKISHCQILLAGNLESLI